MSDEAPKEYEFPKVPINLREASRAARGILWAERIERVSKLVKRGFSTEEIARELGVSEAVIKGTIKRMLEGIQKDFLADASKHRRRLLFKNLQLQKRAWETLDRAAEGKLSKEQDAPIVGGTAGKPTSIKLKKSDAYEAEARLIETLRKLQDQEAKIVGLVIPDEAKPPTTVNVEKAMIVVTNDAQIPATSRWLAAIPQLTGEQGKGLLKSGEPVDAVTVEKKP